MDIITAIKNHNYVEFWYEGHHRKVIPYAYGNQKTTRNTVMRGLQVGGTSSSGKYDVPKLFDVSKMSDIRISSERFADIPAGYKKGDEHIDPIACEL